MIEQRIHRIWADRLDLPEFSDDDDFFALGGHSLIMAKIQATLMDEFDVVIPMDELFRLSTVNKVAGHITALLPA